MHDTLTRLATLHPVPVYREPPYETITATAEPLIKQLRDAIFGEDGRNGGGSQSRARLPLSAPALDLYQEIDDRITEVWVQRFGRVPGAEHPEILLAEWARGIEPHTFVAFTEKRFVPTTGGGRIDHELTSTTALEFLVRIETEIVNLLERPTVQVPVAGPCPAPGCWATTVTRWVDGESVESPTLEFTREQKTGDTLSVSCVSCGTSWNKAQFKEFSIALGQTERGIKPHQVAALHTLANSG